jgi:hypothetical protein
MVHTSELRLGLNDWFWNAGDAVFESQLAKSINLHILQHFTEPDAYSLLFFRWD